MHDDEIGSRTSACAAGVIDTLLASRTNVGLVGFTKWPRKAWSTPPPVVSRHETYGVCRERAEGCGARAVDGPKMAAAAGHLLSAYPLTRTIPDSYASTTACTRSRRSSLLRM
jgi:hypothetical protein